jgi:uncharacterized membrane-anchored protein YitT (DUF2179 family)
MSSKKADSARAAGPARSIWSFVATLAMLQVGAFLAAFALSEFLVPNKIFDGGVVGISMIASYLSKLPLGLFVLVLNLPFLAIGWKRLGWSFVLTALYAIASLSIWLALLDRVPSLTEDIFLATIFGGMVLGAGVGLIIRNGGCLDGTEILAIIINRKLAFSIGEIVMFFNVFIFAAAGVFFGLERALYSVVAYVIAFKMIDLMVEGLDQSKSIFVISERTDEIAQAIMAEMRSTVTIIKGMGGYSRKETDIIYLVVQRLEVPKAKAIAKRIDPGAFLSIHDVHEVVGRNILKGRKTPAGLA